MHYNEVLEIIEETCQEHLYCQDCPFFDTAVCTVVSPNEDENLTTSEVRRRAQAAEKTATKIKEEKEMNKRERETNVRAACQYYRRENNIPAEKDIDGCDVVAFLFKQLVAYSVALAEEKSKEKLPSPAPLNPTTEEPREAFKAVEGRNRKRNRRGDEG